MMQGSDLQHLTPCAGGKLQRRRANVPAVIFDGKANRGGANCNHERRRRLSKGLLSGLQHVQSSALPSLAAL